MQEFKKYGHKTAMTLNELNSNEEPTTGAMDTYIWLPGDTCSPAANRRVAVSVKLYSTKKITYSKPSI